MLVLFSCIIFSKFIHFDFEQGNFFKENSKFWFSKVKIGHIIGSIGQN